MSNALAQADELVYCWCGCGQPTNAKHLRARALVGAGWTHRRTAAELGCHHKYVRVLLRAPAPVSIQGHRRPPTGPAPIVTCIVCGDPCKGIGTRDVCNDRQCDSARWQAGLRSTPQKQREFDRFGSIIEPPSDRSRPQRVLDARGHLARIREKSLERFREYAVWRERRDRERREGADQRQREWNAEPDDSLFAFGRVVSIDVHVTDEGKTFADIPGLVGFPVAPSAEDEALERLEVAAATGEPSGMSCGECGRMQSKGEWVKGACPRCGSLLFVPSRRLPVERIDPSPQVGLGQSNGLTHYMSSRHRGRNARSAAALNNPGGQRKARKPRSKR